MLNAPVEAVPLVARSPLQPSDAVQVEASVLLHESVALSPLAIVLGLALKVTLGTTESTVTVTDWVAVPPGPVQLRSKSVLAVSAPVSCVPLGAIAPFQPPEAVHSVASVLLQVRVEFSPCPTVLGCAVKVIAGCAEPTETTTTCEASPPGPVQISLKSVVSFRAPVSADPVVDMEPLHPPLASQELALSADH